MKNYSKAITCACHSAEIKKIKIFLLTGFLGAGKTTLLKGLLESFGNYKIGVIVNDFGKVNIDSRLVEKEGMTMAEVSNGSIFCACVKDKFVDSLIAMSDHDLDFLFIEASGLADPSNIQIILDGISHKTHDRYTYQSAICVVDGENYPKMSQILPALKRQVENSGIILVNKADLIDVEMLNELLTSISQENPQARIIPTTFCRFDYQSLLEKSLDSVMESQDSLNTPENRPVTLMLESLISVGYSDFVEFLNEVLHFTYRFKGFVKTNEGDFEVSAVSQRFEMKKANFPINKTELVVISAVGIKLYNAVVKASKSYLNEALKII